MLRLPGLRGRLALNQHDATVLKMLGFIRKPATGPESTIFSAMASMVCTKPGDKSTWPCKVDLEARHQGAQPT
jgi:hypothetical protein